MPESAFANCSRSRWCWKPSRLRQRNLGGRRPRLDGQDRRLRSGRKRPPRPHPRDQHRPRRHFARRPRRRPSRDRRQHRRRARLCRRAGRRVLRPRRTATLLVNEIAPRVHNSGHWTEAVCITDQFEQHIRAIAGWPLGDPTRLADVVHGKPDRRRNRRASPRALGPAIRPHAYGKAESRPGRKMGHLNRVTPKTPTEIGVFCAFRPVDKPYGFLYIAAPR